MKLQVDNITVKKRSKLLLDRVDLDVNAGELLVAIGPNGAGKSTLLRVLSGETAADKGQVRLDDLPISEYSLRELSLLMAVLPQQSDLNFPFEVQQVIGFGRIPHDSGNIRDQQIGVEIMSQLEITHLAHRDYTTLSGGEMQRVQLARALSQIWDISGSGFLLLDEPTSSLDLAHQHEVLKLSCELTTKGVGVFMVLHDMNLAARYADRIVLMNEGKVVQLGIPSEVLSEQNLRQVFGVNIRVEKHPEGDHPLVVSW